MNLTEITSGYSGPSLNRSHNTFLQHLRAQGVDIDENGGLDIKDAPHMSSGITYSFPNMGNYGNTIPVKLGTCHTNFSVAGPLLETLKNGPHTVLGNFAIYGPTSLTTLEGMPRRISRALTFNGDMRGLTLHNIHKFCRHCPFVMFNDIAIGSFNSHALSLVMIGGIQKLSIDRGPNELRQVIEILDQHIQHGDVHSAQEALIDAGLSQYAKL